MNVPFKLVRCRCGFAAHTKAYILAMRGVLHCLRGVGA